MRAALPSELKRFASRTTCLVAVGARPLGAASGNAALVFLVGMVTLHRFTNAAWASYNFDSFTMQYDSLRVAHGAVPYRTFFSFPGPGTLWIQALIFALFGAKAVYVVYLNIVVLATLGAALFLLSHALTGRLLVSWWPPLALFFALAPRAAYPYHFWYGALPLVAAILCINRWLRRGNRRWLVFAGACCAATGLFV
jgi:hypothetical protein